MGEIENRAGPGSCLIFPCCGVTSTLLPAVGASRSVHEQGILNRENAHNRNRQLPQYIPIAESYERLMMKGCLPFQISSSALNVAWEFTTPGVMNIQLAESRSMSGVYGQCQGREWAVPWRCISGGAAEAEGANSIPLCREYAGPGPWHLPADLGVTSLPAPMAWRDGSQVCVPLTVMFSLGPNLVALYLRTLSCVQPRKRAETTHPSG